MPSKKYIEGYYLRVEPRSLGDLGAVSVSDRLLEPDHEKRMKRYLARVESMKDQIRRHVDDVGSVHIETDFELICEFCEARWTEPADSLYNGGCCEDDEVFNPEKEIDP